MKGKLVTLLAIPGLVAGILVTMGILNNLFALAILWLFIIILYPFVVTALLPGRELSYTFMVVFLCGSLIVWVPVEEFVTFIKCNPEKIDWLNYKYRHPRRMMLEKGQIIVFFSSVVSLIITDILIGMRKIADQK